MRTYFWQNPKARAQELLALDFGRQVAETFAVRVLLTIVSLITTVLIARLLGPDGRGLYAVLMTIATVGVQLGNLGFHSSNTYYVAQNRSLMPTLASNSLLLSAFAGGGCGLLAWTLFAAWPEVAPARGSVLLPALIWMPIGLAYLLLQNLLLGIQDVRAFNLIELATRLLGVGLIAIIVLLDLISVQQLFGAALIAVALGVVFLIWRISHHMSGWLPPSVGLIQENIRYGLKAYLSALCSFLVLRVDVFMVQHMLGNEQTGYYSIAVAMADMVLMLPLVIGMLLFPKLTAMQNAEHKWSATGRVLKLTGMSMAVLGVIAALVAEPLVRMLFGGEFSPAVPAFMWLIPGVVLLSINMILMNYFAAIGMPAITVYSPLLATVVNVGLNIELIPHWGISGAAMASTLAYGLMLFASIIYLKKEKQKRQA
ncbi:MAG: flippase [Gammaproteobacteria bacterium]